MKTWKVYFENWKIGLEDALKNNDWEYEADTEEEARAWMEENEDCLTSEELYLIYHEE